LSINSGRELYRRTQLDNGIRVVTETLPHVRSLAIGIWIDTGSRDEPEQLAGISHYLEHMNFKGTERRSPLEIARSIEGHGGQLNAFTGKHETCFYARVISSHLVRAVDVLADITQHSVYDPTETIKERKVILEELKNVEDTPDEMVFEYFWAEMYPNHSLGRTVIGTPKTLKKINPARLREYSQSHYCGSRIVVAVTGDVDHDRLVELIQQQFKSDQPSQRLRVAPQNDLTGHSHHEHHSSTQQAHILWGLHGITYYDPRKYALFIMNTVLGGGMSSRLFQHIREDRGLAYTVYSFLETLPDSGMFGVYAGTDPENVEQTLNLIKEDVLWFADNLLSDEELDRTKDQLKGALLLGLESPSSRMNRLARMESLTGGYLSIDDIIENINAVSAESIKELASEMFTNKPTVTTLLLPK